MMTKKQEIYEIAKMVYYQEEEKQYRIFVKKRKENIANALNKIGVTIMTLSILGQGYAIGRDNILLFIIILFFYPIGILLTFIKHKDN